jgi:hypothetical protein
MALGDSLISHPFPLGFPERVRRAAQLNKAIATDLSLPKIPYGPWRMLYPLTRIIHDFAGEKRKGALKD